MSNKYKCVQINLEESLYEHIKSYVDIFIPDTDISYFLKCCLINHLININVLNQVGLPNTLIFPPKIDYLTID